jgi:hypothetical protein
MPIDGTLDIAPLVDEAPLVTDLATEPVVLEGAEVLQVMFEIDSKGVDSMLPPALHPTDPRVVTLLWITAKDSPIGSFKLAQVRIGCRAGVRPRGYVMRTVLDGSEAAAVLASRWGFNCVHGDVELKRGYHAIEGCALLDGRMVLCASLVDPMPLSGAEIQFAAGMQLARVQRNGSAEPRLVQVDPELTFQRAARGHAEIDAFDAAAWGDARIEPVYPVSAWWALCDLTLPKVRYILDPNVTALQGTEKLP